MPLINVTDTCTLQVSDVALFHVVIPAVDTCAVVVDESLIGLMEVDGPEVYDGGAATDYATLQADRVSYRLLERKLW